VALQKKLKEKRERKSFKYIIIEEKKGGVARDLSKTNPVLLLKIGCRVGVGKKKNSLHLAREKKERKASFALKQGE